MISPRTAFGRKQHEDFIANLKKVWEFNHIEVPLPRAL